MNNQVAEDSPSENHTGNTKYTHTTDEENYLNGLGHVDRFTTPNGYYTIEAEREFYFRLILQIVQLHYYNNYCERKEYKI